MRNKTAWVLLFFLLAIALVTMIFDLAFSEIFLLLGVENKPLLGARFSSSTLWGLIIASTIAALCAFLFQSARLFVEQSIVEMWKAHWPTWPETKLSTWTVIVTSFVAAIILGFFDTFFGWLTASLLLFR